MPGLRTPHSRLALPIVAGFNAINARLGDVGDAWRALLLGAPPTFL